MFRYRNPYILVRYLKRGMKLQSQISRKYEGKEGDKEYRKYWIILPTKHIEKLGWKTGEKLETEITDDKIIIERD